MKRFVFFFALILMQVSVALAQEPVTRVNSEKVKMYRQPGVSTEVMRVLSTEDEIVVMRKIDSEWSLVEINGEGGYVLNAYLKAKKGKKGATAKASSTPSPSASRQ